MFENIINFFKRNTKKDKNVSNNSKDTAKERLHLVLMQDRANVSVDFLELMKQEIIDVIKKYIDIDESAIDVRLTNKENEDGTNGAPALYANIPILNIKNDARKMDAKEQENDETKKKEKSEENKPKETKQSKEPKEEKEKEKQEETKKDNKDENKSQESEDTKKEEKSEKNEEVEKNEKAAEIIIDEGQKEDNKV